MRVIRIPIADLLSGVVGKVRSSSCSGDEPAPFGSCVINESILCALNYFELLLGAPFSTARSPVQTTAIPEQRPV